MDSDTPNASDVKIHGIYRHSSGRFYIVEGVAENTETGEKMVVYRALHGENELYVRTLNSFVHGIEEHQDGSAGRLFTLCESNEPRMFPRSLGFDAPGKCCLNCRQYRDFRKMQDGSFLAVEVPGNPKRCMAYGGNGRHIEYPGIHCCDEFEFKAK